MNMLPDSRPLSHIRLLRTLWLLLAVSLCLPGLVSARDFDRLSHFETCNDFINALKAFQPQKQPNIYSRCFSIEDFGEGQADALIVPEKIASVTEVWRNEDYALVFATARPKTEASNSEVGAIIVLRHDDGGWRFQDLRRYETIGKYAGFTCALTSASYKDYEPGHGTSPAVLTLVRSSGGRGASESASLSLLFENGQLHEYR